MAEIQKQEWGKARIQAEMKDLTNARKLRYNLAAVLGLSGVGCIVAAVSMMLGPIRPVPTGPLVPFIVVGIVLVLVSILVLRSGLAKSRQYNDLKRKL
ncbi:MAG: hypothetical protein DDT34_02483 [Firmicutes bacterium]|nr:hypothetical protein [Bacillota bacterium]